MCVHFSYLFSKLNLTFVFQLEFLIYPLGGSNSSIHVEQLPSPPVDLKWDSEGKTLHHRPQLYIVHNLNLFVCFFCIFLSPTIVSTCIVIK